MLLARLRTGLMSLAALWAVAAPCAAQVNQISGRIGFSNANPEILAILGAPVAAGLNAVSIAASSQPPAPLSSHDTTLTPPDPVVSPWALDVASSPAGTTYRVVASAQLGLGILKDEYYFLPATSPPVFDEPAPDATLDLLECAGIIRVRFVDASGAPVTLRGDRVTADSSAGGVSPLAFIGLDTTQKDVVVRGDGSTYTVRVEMTFGSDPFVDRMTQLASGTVVVNCDEIADFPVRVVTPGDAELGRIRGELDILGEDEIVSSGAVANSRSHVEATGPWRNLRADDLPGPPSQGSWVLGNLVPSNVVSPEVPYAIKAQAAFGSGQDFRSFTTPSIDQLVAPGADVDLGRAFVIDPVEISGRVLLAGPPAVPGIGSPLQDLWRASDRDTNRDGIPDDLARLFDSTVVIGRGRFGVAPGATRSALGAEGEAILQGAYDPVTASVDGAYRLVLGNLASEPGYYAANELNLKFLDTTVPANPPSYIDARVDVDDPAPQWELSGGAAVTRDRAYCLSRVTIGFTNPTGTLFLPDLAGTGSFSGTDFQGNPADYTATLWWARGTPTTLSRAAPSGQSSLALPAGTWTLEPSMRVPGPGNTSTIVALAPFTLEVGCRQALEAVPEVQVALATEVEPCTGATTLSVTGTAHADAGVESVTWSVNGGTPQPACTSCGVDAPFAFDATLVPGDDVIRVEAVDAAGRRAAAELRTRLAPEPSAIDLRPASAPVTVTKDPAGLLVTWEPEPRDGFAIHAGSIASLHAGTYDHARVGACGRSGASAIIPEPAGSAYLLVAASCGAGEGSYGRDSLGRERPPSPDACP